MNKQPKPIYHCPYCEYEWESRLRPPRQPKLCPACTWRLPKDQKWPRVEEEEGR